MQPIIGIIGNFNGALIPEHANLPISYIGQGYLDAVKKAGGEVNPLSWTKESNLGGFTMTKFSFE
ncbi:gamma-glutamyl-gamma-aminobutyrate hydrolase family protein, partial [Ligilactobacillus murinus]|nr:gamma-glutamyl-gamma-aminobutyrate hydrolase family protein [Ligilactobacillus murinus]